ncbi:MAG TPA: cell division protein ZapA [Bryobacteraceae bacterium]|nr:cell division protein ZapA [Bryobacteraceae bacterium]
MESAVKKPVRVTILSRPYTLRTVGDPAEVEALAASIDELMLNIASKAPNADSTHIAVLACLHLADSLREAERELGRLKERIGEKSQRFAGLLDQLISSAGESHTGEP